MFVSVLKLSRNGELLRIKIGYSDTKSRRILVYTSHTFSKDPLVGALALASYMYLRSHWD